MIENEFNSDLAAGLRSQGIWAHKLPDLARAVVKPFDIVANCRGRFWAIEGKARKVKLKPDETEFASSLVVIDRYDKVFRPHQLQNLKMIQLQGGVGFIALYLSEDKPNSRLKAAWLVDVQYFLGRDRWTVNDLSYLSRGLSVDTLELRRKPNCGWIASEWLINGYGMPH